MLRQIEDTNHQTAEAKIGWTQLRHKKPLLIAGPCSAESREQVLQSAQLLQATQKVDIMRAGIWKPRTRPGNFEGMGEAALPWMQEALALTGLPFATEVASARQVELALKYDCSVLWIGARSTANPFSVQEIADALKGVTVPVLIKNPVSPDIDLWVGALERVEKSGIKDIGLIHRGFSFYGRSEYRNAPTWKLALEMKRRYPEWPFMVDPSHICGKRHLLKEVVQSAIDLDYDGIMIESHPHPDEALSDAAQQITPADLVALLNEIVWRKETDSSEEIQQKLARYRRIIDHVDDDILNLLSRRMQIAAEIGMFKKKHNLTILQTARWNETLDRLIAMTEKLNLSPEFIKQYYDAIHMESIAHQDKIMNEQPKKN
ncbi:MAG TPA: bifunctional 3-deoxy-7-phosphoheptulonate synthase/chorismate mutase type II [Edaphocola sp.]|nr:bifunctional 3-deoxy-7-phosphoheptulonate synthase/chorismate mutase type II [Edaphocola sp.]